MDQDNNNQDDIAKQAEELIQKAEQTAGEISELIGDAEATKQRIAAIEASQVQAKTEGPDKAMADLAEKVDEITENLIEESKDMAQLSDDIQKEIWKDETQED